MKFTVPLCEEWKHFWIHQFSYSDGLDPVFGLTNPDETTPTPMLYKRNVEANLLIGIRLGRISRL